MSLILGEKINKSIERLQMFEPEDGYFVAFSGGKDSQCVYELCKLAGVKFDAHYSLTGIDPPELLRFIHEYYPDVIWEIPRYADGRRITMWNLIPEHKMPPTRKVRYCCEKLKESGGKGRVTVTGVRWEESSRRKATHGVASVKTQSKKLIEQADDIEGSSENGKGSIILNDDNDEARRFVESCYRTRKTIVNPIVDWTTDDVWEFLNDIVKVPHCELYDKGLKRLGCIGCPMSKNPGKELKEYPAFRRNYMLAFERMLKVRIAAGIPNKEWRDAEDVMKWWLGDKYEDSI